MLVGKKEKKIAHNMMQQEIRKTKNRKESREGGTNGVFGGSLMSQLPGISLCVPTRKSCLSSHIVSPFSIKIAAWILASFCPVI